MDLILLITIAITLLLIAVSSFIFLKKSNTQKEEAPVRAAAVPERLQAGVPRRAQIARNQRDRNRNRAAANVENRVSDQENSDEEAEEKLTDFGNEKIGTKKRAKLEAKAEKKSQREVELKIREDKKQKDLLAADEKTKLDALEQEEEKRQEELLLQAEKEKARADHEAYLKLKEAFSVEEEGFEEEDEEDKKQLEDFVNYIHDNKVVILEDLATTFKLKTQSAIERIQDLQNNGSLTGVIDDRGKFIYISEDELQQVAKFVKQRGRITITELAESSNQLINLTPAVAVSN